MSATGESGRRILRGVGYAVPVVAPLLLLANLEVTFPADWPHHLWMIGYCGEYFRQHGDMPMVVNITPAVGIAQPVFYAYLLYPVLGLVSAAFGAALALRAAVFLMLAIQFYALISVGRKIFQNKGVAYTVAVSVVWATYSLTVLYNRGAIPEYFATGFLVTAAAFGGAAAVETVTAQRYFDGWLAAVFSVLAVGTHPPTAVLAAAFIALLGAGLAVSWGRNRLKFSGTAWALWLGGCAGGAFMLSPWAYASFLFSAKLSIAQASDAFVFYLDRCDSFWARFAPFPYDALSTERGTYFMATPYLEAPINVVLLVILLWNLELCRRSTGRLRPAAGPGGNVAAKVILGAAIAWFLLLAAISVSPRLAGAFRFFAPYIQYVYRLVSHCNAAMLVAVLASGVMVVRHAGYRRYRHQTNLVLAVCLTIASLGLWIKLQHAAVAGTQSSTPQFEFGGDRAPLISKGQVVLAIAYDTPGLRRVLNETEARNARSVLFPVGDAGREFGEIGKVEIELKKAGWVLTNAVVFPWMELVVDGKKPGANDLAQWDRLMAVYLPAGRHEIQPVWQPDGLWLVLHRISQATFALVLATTVAWAGARLFFRRNAGREGHGTEAVQY